MPWHVSLFTAEFRAYFERFGRVMSAEVMFNRETHKSRGFGFIVFELEKGAEHVCAEREHIIDGKVVRLIMRCCCYIYYVLCVMYCVLYHLTEQLHPTWQNII